MIKSPFLMDKIPMMVKLSAVACTKAHGIIDAHAAYRHRVSVGLKMSVMGGIDQAVCRMLVISVYIYM